MGKHPVATEHLAIVDRNKAGQASRPSTSVRAIIARTSNRRLCTSPDSNPYVLRLASTRAPAFWPEQSGKGVDPGIC
jgi:hypothetical protein